MLRASFTQGSIRPGFDLVISPLNSGTVSSPPLIEKRRIRWLLGAVIGTYNINEKGGIFEKTLMTGVTDMELINIVLRYDLESCRFVKKNHDDVLWRPCDDSSKVS